MRPFKMILLLSAAALVSPSIARGGTIWDNGTADQSNGLWLTRSTVGDDFTIGADASVSQVRFWSVERQGQSVTPYQGHLAWAIISDLGGANQSYLFSGETDAVTRTYNGPTALSCCGSVLFDEYENEFSIGTIRLGPGTYWLALHAGAPNAISYLGEMYWETAATSSSAKAKVFLLDLPEYGWTTYPYQLAFQLTSDATVPEPSGILLVLTGTVVILLLRLGSRRRIRAAQILRVSA
jgi:hypothetical protein